MQFVEGASPAQVASDLGVTGKTVRNWQGRYVAGGIEALRDRPSSGRPGIFTVAQRCEVVAIAATLPGIAATPTALAGPWTD